MARKLRIQYPGAIYHVMNRGDRRETIFDPQYLAAPSRRPRWLRVDRLLGEWGIPKDSEAGRRVFEERMEWRRGEDLRGEFKRVERGWCLGGEAFRQELLEQVETRPGPSHFGEAVQEAEQARGERIVAEGLRRMGWSEAELRGRRKGEPGKVELAWELRSQTTMPLAWMAERLQMGSRGHLAWLLQQRGKTRLAAPTDQCRLRI